MALVLKDRVKETTTTTGTGTLTLLGAATGYQSFSAIGNGNTCYYAISSTGGAEWEVGIGTYTASGTTLSRDTVLSSSNAGALVNLSAGTKDVYVVYPAEKSVYEDASNKVVQSDFVNLGVSGTATINAAALTTGTVSTTPASATDIANKQYVDTMASSGVHFHQPVRVESPTPLNATYNNGTAGVGATLTNAGTQTALVIDGVTLSVNDRVLIYTQTNATQNGIYTVTNVGSGSTNWVLTRATDADEYGIASSTALGEGSAVFVSSGNTGAGETYVCNTTGTITFGTTNITFAQISATQIYSAGTGLTLTNTTFSLSNVGTAGTYGSASAVPVLTTNAQGQVTGVTNTNIAINANQVTAGTLAVARGGTGLGSYAVGDIVYASGTGTLAGLAGVATGNVLLSGGTNTAPAYGKVGLTTHVSGILPTANGGTNLSSFTSGGAVYATSTSALTTGTLPVTAGGTGVATLSGIAFGNGTSAFSAASAAQIVSAIGSTAVTNATNATNATNTTNVGITDDTATSTTVYPVWSNGTSGNQALEVTSTRLSFVPSTGVLTATNFSGGGASLSNLNASNLGSGTVPSARVSGSYTGITGVGTLTAGTWNASAISDTYLSTISTAGKVANSATTATNLNTASAIVARDASGNFAAGIITAALAGNATTATTLQTARNINGVSFNGSADITITASNPNAVTFNNGGAGAASGSTYTGASTLTVSYNTIGAPSTTGTNASGTWNISISGNAATATSATSATSATNATNATNVGIVDDTTTATSVYPVWANSTSGNQALETSSTKLSFVPSTGVLTATTLSGAHTGNGSGLTDLNASNLASGTVNTARVSGSYTGITGVGTLTAGTWNASAISDTYLSTISTAGKVANSATTATSANTANAIVARDASGNFSAGTITATLSGNASTATSATSVTGATQSSITSIPNLATVGTITSGTWSGSFGAVSGANLTNLNASNLSTGTVSTARLGTGTANSTTFLRGDGTWATAGGNTTTFGLYENAAVISANYTISNGNNAVSAGPITVNSGVTVTVPSGSVWTVV